MSRLMNRRAVAILLLILVSLAVTASDLRAQDEESIPKAPARSEGEGPFGRLILRGGTLIAGTGAPAMGRISGGRPTNRVNSERGLHR